MAMSLGWHGGATLMGRPLDISVQAALEARDDAANLYLDEDFFMLTTGWINPAFA